MQARQQDLQLERFRQVIVGAGLEPLQDVGRAAARGQHQHRHEVPLGAQLLNDLKAVASRQHHVEHDRVIRRAIGEQAIERGLAVAIDVNRVALGLEVEPQAIGQVCLVFNDQDAAHLFFTRGNSSVNVAPLPSPMLSANTRPPCALAMERTMKRPSPVPLTVRPRGWKR